MGVKEPIGWQPEASESDVTLSKKRGQKGKDLAKAQPNYDNYTKGQECSGEGFSRKSLFLDLYGGGRQIQHTSLVGPDQRDGPGDKPGEACRGQHHRKGSSGIAQVSEPLGDPHHNHTWHKTYQKYRRSP